MTQTEEPLYASAPYLGRVDPSLWHLQPRQRWSRRAIVRLSLAIADALALAAAFGVALIVFGYDSSVDPGDRVSSQVELIVFFLSLPLWLLLAHGYGLYNRDEERADHSVVEEIFPIVNMLTLGTAAFVVVVWATHAAEPHLPKILTFWAAAVVTMALFRGAARFIARRTSAYRQRTVIVGGGDVGELLAEKLERHSEFGIVVVGTAGDASLGAPGTSGYVPRLGSPDRLIEIVREHEVERVVVAFTGGWSDGLQRALRLLRASDVQIDIVPRFCDLVGPGADVTAIEGFPVIGLSPARPPLVARLVKRALDLTASAVVLLFLSPLFLYAALRIKLDSPGPVFYRHERVGKDGRPIRVFKFRTMHIDYCRGADYGGARAEEKFTELMGDPELRRQFETHYKIENDPRVTGVGGWLRRTSIDELPQLINVLIGDLSLVGPRPITTAELERYGSEGESALLLTVKPGLTGYWQINGRSEIGYAERVRLDLSYVGNWSLSLDLAILAKTVRVVLTRSGAY